MEFPEHKQEVSNIINTTFISLFGVNNLVSPLFSSLLSKYFGFRAMMDCLFLFLLAVDILYLGSTIYDWLHESRKYREITKKAEEEEENEV